MNGSIARRDDAQYFFFVLLATLFRGIKPLNRCFAPSSFINDVMSLKGVRKNVSQHPCGARYGSRVRAERSDGEVPGICLR